MPRYKKSRSGRLFAIALAQRAWRRNAGSGVWPRGVSASTVASATSMPAMACVTLSIAPAQPLEPLFDLLFESLFRGHVEARAGELVGQIGLALHVAARKIGRVLIALAVAFFAHQARHGVAQFFG